MIVIIMVFKCLLVFEYIVNIIRIHPYGIEKRHTRLSKYKKNTDIKQVHNTRK